VFQKYHLVLIMPQRLIYGIHAVQQAIKTAQSGTLYLQDDRHDARVQVLMKQTSKHIAVQKVSKAQLDQIVAARHQGVVLMLQKHDTTPLPDLKTLIAQAGDNALVLVLDGVQDPHNLGACLRNADATGVCAVVVPKDKACAITPIVRKVACGAAETMAVFSVTNVARTIEQLQQIGCWVIGLTGEAHQSLYDLDLKGPTAIVVGAEGAGMRRLTKEKCDFLAKLPMLGSVESLNVSVATGVVLYEAIRQRLYDQYPASS